MKGQAALFDGILFLLLVMFSVGMVYSYLSTYGVAHERTLRASHEVNYMQSIVKALYSVDASTLKNVPKWEANPAVVNPAYADLDCNKTAPYVGRFSVAELLKKDLSDFSGSADADSTCGGPSYLDDKFGSSDAPGTTALRCALKEFMKPFTFAGMDYLAEVHTECPGKRVPVMRKEGGAETLISSRSYNATPAIRTCDEASAAFSETFAVRAPFRIRVDLSSGPKTFTYTLTVCTWRKPV